MISETICTGMEILELAQCQKPTLCKIKKANILNHKSIGNNLIRTLKAGVSIQPTLSAGRLNFTSTFSQGCRTYFGFFGLFYLYPIIVHH